MMTTAFTENSFYTNATYDPRSVALISLDNDYNLMFITPSFGIKHKMAEHK